LPDGWEEMVDPSSGNVYYYNSGSNATSWDRPTEVSVALEEEEEDDVATDEKEEIVFEADESIHEDALPDGWEEMVDQSSGNVYYYNAESGVTSWDRPTESLDVEEDEDEEEEEDVATDEKEEEIVFEADENADEDALPDGWEEMVDQSSGNVYYYNAESGITSWDRPTEAPGVDEDEDIPSDVLEDLTEDFLVATEEPVAEEEDIPSNPNEEPDSATNDLAHEAELSLPDGWEKMEDPSSGKTYYHNAKSGETSWDRPEDTPDDLLHDDAESESVQINDNHEDQENVSANSIEAEEKDTQPPSDPLPDYWVEAEDPSSGGFYFYNTLTEEVSWERPSDSTESSASGELNGDFTFDEINNDDHVGSDTESIESVRSPLPEGWVESTDPTSGDTYYYNVNSEETSWDRPEKSPSKSVPKQLVETKAKSDTQSEPDYVMTPNEGEEPIKNDMNDLLDGWVEVIDSSSGNCYWYNNETQETTWEKPSKHVDDEGTGEPDKNDDGNMRDDWVDVHDPLTENDTVDNVEYRSNVARESLKPLPPGWVESIDQASGKIFYWNESTGETSWDRPDSNTDPSSSVEGDSTENQKIEHESQSESHGESRNISDIADERNRFGVSGPFTLCDESVVIEYIKNKARSNDILWQLIAIVVQSKGRLRSDYGAVDKSGPEAAIVKLLLHDPDYSSHKTTSKNDIVIEDRIDDELEVTDSIVRVQDLLIRGDRENAIEEAMAIGDFATALLVASMCDSETYKSVAQQYARSKFRTDSPMYTTTMLFSGKIESPSSRNSSNWGVKAEELRENWKSHLAAIINNRTFGWDKVVLSLGDRLVEIGNIKEAHFCYMVCGYPITSPTDNETRVSLLGCDHADSRNCTLLTGESLIAFERTEAYEWAKRLGNRDAYFPTFQPFKLIYAMLLADIGEVIKAQEFVQSIQISLETARTAAIGITKVSIRQMFDNDVAFELAYREIEERLLSKGEPKSKYGDQVLNGGNIEISVNKAHNGMINGRLGPEKKVGQPSAVLDKSRNLMQNKSKDAALDETFMTAKTNLMDRSDYSLDERVNRESATTNETGRQMPRINDQSINYMKNPPKEEKKLAAPAPAPAPNAKPKLQPKYEEKPLATNNVMVGHPPQKQQLSKPMSDSTPPPKSQLSRKERPVEAPSTAPPVMTGKGKEKAKETPKKAPASSGTPKQAPGSGTFGGMKSWLIKKLNPNAKECYLPESEEQPYFDKELKRWVFPGDDPVELAKPMAPPPTVIKKEEVKKEEPKDAVSSMMAPPPSRISAMKKPMGGGPPGGGMMPPMMGGMMMPPGAAPPGMMSPIRGATGGAAGIPKIATFTPKPVIFTPKATTETPSEKQDVPTDDQHTGGN